MALVLAVILGFILIVRIASNKAEHIIAGKEYNETKYSFEERRYEWINKTVNRQIEQWISAGVSSRNKELMDELQRTWYFYYYYQHQFPGVKALCHTDNSIYTGNNAFNEITAQRILLANRGLLREEDAKNGINVSFVNGLSIEQDYVVISNFISSINNKLKEFGINENMYFNHINYYYQFPFENKSMPKTGTTLQSGKVLWEPIISPFGFCVTKL